jgi:hypothetical protein
MVKVNVKVKCDKYLGMEGVVLFLIYEGGLLLSELLHNILVSVGRNMFSEVDVTAHHT